MNKTPNKHAAQNSDMEEVLNVKGSNLRDIYDKG